ncbi:hypothetical protein [Streptomyces atratus]|uniref:hypothetical protein n=1 Tax=Streptomyces atratus TaxID=1893 RepID=UPI0022592D05|nr:hypothetical protein [Streptomyces atratus]
MKRERSSEESESGNGRGGASGGTVPDSSQGAVPGSIGAPSAPSSRTVTEGGGTSVTGGKDGGARTPTSSKSGPEEAEEPAAQTPAVVHAAGVSIGRTTSEPEEQPGGEDSAVAQEEATPAAGRTAVVATTAITTAAGTASAASSGVAESTAGTTAEANTSSATAVSEPTPPSGTSAPAATASEATASAEPAAAASTAGSTAAAAVVAEPTAATAAASAAASSSPPGGAAAGEGGAPERPGRVSRPMVVAAAFAGALLLATPFVVAGAQKDEAKPESREAAAAWKGDGRAGGYVPDTDPDSPEGKRAAGADKPGGTPARGDKGPVGDVRADTGDGRKPADGSAEAETKGAKGSKGSTTGAADKTAKSGSGDKAPAGTGSDTPTKAPSAGSAPKSAPAVVYSGVSGPECPTQRFQKSGYYSDGKEGWATHSGGFGGYGCAGKYLSMPMSGSSSKDSGGSATWLFDLPATARKCSISVHVPGSSDIVRVGGNPSYYTVYDRFLPRTSNLVGSYYVRQKERRGTWYNVPGTFSVDAKKLSVQLHDRGEDNNYEHHAISALKVTCTG